MIEIDDAGYGSLIEGCAIGAYRPETSQFVCQFIPVEYFQKPYFSQGKYLTAATEAVKYLLETLGVCEDEPIHICRGWIFTQAKSWLSQSGYNWQEAKIVDPLQSLVEETFRKKLTSLGVNIYKDTPPGQHFYRCLKWLKGGDINGKALKEREALAKTGWDSYAIWAYLPYPEAKRKAAQARRAKKATWIKT
jgi:hypothetical protein